MSEVGMWVPIAFEEQRYQIYSEAPGSLLEGMATSIQ